MTPIEAPRPVGLIIFDCDGVLIDSELISCTVDAELLTEAGYPITAAEVAARFTGVPSAAVYATVEAELGTPLPEDMECRYTERVMAKYRSDLQPLAGIMQVLDRLPHPRCVASSSSPAKLALGLIETGLYECFYPHIFSTSLVSEGKPAPDLFLYAAGRMRIAPTHCVVIEDSVAGVTAARRAGMAAIGFTGGSHCGPEQGARLREAGAFRTIGAMSDLPDLLGAPAVT